MEYNKDELPEHIAIIMDGNRRWARSKGKTSNYGHKEGAENLVRIVRYANKIKLKYLTVYAFSTENWKRTAEEVNGLMLIFRSYLDNYLKRAETNNIKINIIGDISAFNENLQKSILKCVERTKNNTGTVITIALNYGGRAEIIRATREIARKVKNNELKLEDIDEKTISSHMYTYNIPDPDLIIRTSNEIRLSGFLTWQATYAELYFAEKNWPDFNEEELDIAIHEYQKRNRRFGGN